MTTVIKSTRSKLLELPPLFHISFNGKLEGVWDPEFNQKPDDNHPEEPVAEEDQWYPEPSIGRISVAPTIEGCFRGVWANLSMIHYPHVNYYVYSPVFKGKERVVTPDTLVKDRLVWDAHVTQEYLILDEVEMKLVGEIQVVNRRMGPYLRIHPFGDPKEPETRLGPEFLQWKWTKVIKDTKQVSSNLLSLFK